MNPWVILPTYNERENIDEIIRRILQQPIASLSVLVVDDASPDGTGDRADELAKHYPSLHVLHREKKGGLASAYVEGFRFALGKEADFLFEMDADFSHNPDMLPAFLQAATDGADLVLGSRYVPGGHIHNWNWPRRFVSRFGNWYARHALALPFADLTGGFKCFRRSTLDRIGLDTVTSTGYNFQIELTCKAARAGLRIQEIPITFTERRLGRSKFHLGIVFESIRGVWRLRRAGRTLR